MAKRPKLSKIQAVRDYLLAHPGAMPSEIVAALNKQGVKITRSHAGNIKTKINKEAPTKHSAFLAPPPAGEKPAKNGDTITLTQVRLVAATIKTLGGYERLSEVLAVIKELGGLKRFKDLAEAMSVTGTDDIPF
jgi:hypothetical protein